MNLAKHLWWVLLLRGLLAIIFGAIVLGHPALTLKILVFVFCIYVFVTGAIALITAFSNRQQNPRWWVTALEGAVGVIAGIIIWSWPWMSGLMLLYVIAAWAVVTGVMQLCAAIVFGKQAANSVLLGVSGVVSILFGGLVIVYPVQGALALAWLIGLYALVFGALFIISALQMRHVSKLLG